MLFDYNKMDRSEALVRLSGLKRSALPPLVKPTDVVGSVTEAAAQATGLASGTPVICGTTDTVMEVFASGAVKPGDITVKPATAGRIRVVTDKSHPHLIHYSHVADGLWYSGTATKSCAASYRWYRDTFGGDYPTLNSGAEKIAPGCDGLMFHPYLNGELTPYRRPHALRQLHRDPGRAYQSPLYPGGHGARHCLESIRAFADHTGAELAASKLVADGGILPYSMQVGLTGKTVCPSVCLAVGISGAVHHIAGTKSYGTVIAVNPDRGARSLNTRTTGSSPGPKKYSAKHNTNSQKMV